MKKIIITLSFLGIMAGAATSAFAGYFNTTPVNSCDVQITRTLQIGSENSDVSVLQSMLLQAGYLFVQPNGYFGPSTKAAVKRFQNDNSVPVTGIVGEATRNAINERLCDADVRGDSYSYNSYGYGDNSGTTYVDQYDPYVKVISPQVTTPVVYASPQESVKSFSSLLGTQLQYSSNGTISSSLDQIQTVDSVYNPASGYNYGNVGAGETLTPATNQIQGTHIVYNPGTGYSYGITQKTGSITIVTPSINSSYNEGDTVNLVWITSGLNASGFHISLENTNSSQSKEIATTGGTNFSFVLTKELLDAICTGSCNDSQKGAFKIVISTPVTDIAGNTSLFKAAISPVTVYRPYSTSAAVTLTTSTSPVNSGQAFKLYVNSSAINLANPAPLTDIIVKLRAACVNSIQVSIAGIPCGQELSMPASILSAQQGVPVMITNTTWYKQDVVFSVTLTTLTGQTIGTAQTTVVSNPAPFSW